jgi:hypothetical protein
VEVSKAGIEEKAGKRGVDPVRVVRDQLEVEGVPRGFEEKVFAGVAEGGLELAGEILAASVFEASRAGGGRPTDLTVAASGASDRDTASLGAAGTSDAAVVGAAAVVEAAADDARSGSFDGGADVTAFASERPFGGATLD